MFWLRRSPQFSNRDLPTLEREQMLSLLDGFGTIEKIRKDPNFKSLPVLAVTAYAMHGDREKILTSGFNGYLSKPINPMALQQELERLLSNNRNSK
jgi:CheY-like chemotaxis protein